MRSRGVLLVVLCGSVCVCMCRIDELFRARCIAACSDHPKNKNECESICSLTTTTKPGKCPLKASLNVFQKACIHSCSRDVDCLDTEKCCKHDCGATCQSAVDLHLDPGLPAVPANLTVMDSRRQRCKKVQWSAQVGGDRVYYVLQERRHPGLELRPHQFGPWRSCARRRKNKYLLTGLTPGYWYQVRVAAINPNGSRGYSDPSDSFHLRIEPSVPEEPLNLTVSRPGWVNGSLWAELRWRRPASDLPLNHYKVFWSHCVKSELEETLSSNTCKPKSVIVIHKNVKYANTKFILKNLEPQSLYFIQVQALTIPYGKKKLSSEKAAIFIDTNKLKNATYNWKVQPQNTVQGLRLVQFYRTSVDRLEARVTWESAPGRFLVKWSPHPHCKTPQSNPTHEATTENLQFEIDRLIFNCKYQLFVNAIGSTKSAKITFKTPDCIQMNSKLPCL